MSGRSATGPRMMRRTTIATTRDLTKSLPLTKKRKAGKMARRKSTMRKMMRMRR